MLFDQITHLSRADRTPLAINRRRKTEAIADAALNAARDAGVSTGSVPVPLVTGGPGRSAAQPTDRTRGSTKGTSAIMATSCALGSHPASTVAGPARRHATLGVRGRRTCPPLSDSPPVDTSTPRPVVQVPAAFAPSPKTQSGA